MIKHKVYVKRQRQGLGERSLTSLCRRAVKATLQEEGVDTPCEVSVLATDDKGIRELNQQHRSLDEPTDVLSFPMQTFVPGSFKVEEKDLDPETGYLHLGDIVLSAERAEAQGEEYGHGTGRETAYLMVHATLHLLGYDHMDEEDQKLMRSREEHILGGLGLLR